MLAAWTMTAISASIKSPWRRPQADDPTERRGRFPEDLGQGAQPWQPMVSGWCPPKQLQLQPTVLLFAIEHRYEQHCPSFTWLLSDPVSARCCCGGQAVVCIIFAAAQLRCMPSSSCCAHWHDWCVLLTASCLAGAQLEEAAGALPTSAECSSDVLVMATGIGCCVHSAICYDMITIRIMEEPQLS